MLIFNSRFGTLYDLKISTSPLTLAGSIYIQFHTTATMDNGYAALHDVALVRPCRATGAAFSTRPYRPCYRLHAFESQLFDSPWGLRWVTSHQSLSIPFQLEGYCTISLSQHYLNSQVYPSW